MKIWWWMIQWIFLLCNIGLFGLNKTEISIDFLLNILPLFGDEINDDLRLSDSSIFINQNENQSMND